MQNAIAADARVYDGDGLTSVARQQTGGQNIGPAMVGVDGGMSAIGDRIAEGDDGRRGRRGEHVHAGQKHPGGDGRRVFGESGRAGEVAGAR